MLAARRCHPLVGLKDLLFERGMASVTKHQEALMARGLPKRNALPGVANIVIVASGKGGVGKSTIASNLAVSLVDAGKRVGLLDADVFGPSIPLMMNVHEEPLVDEHNRILPPINYGVKCLSMGMLTQQDSAFIWRGPLVMSAVQRLLKGAVWGPLDVLIVDTPPGTGDVHLSLSQNVPITGVLLVSTPQMAALEVTCRGAQMYRALKVPILGLVENMGHAVCDNCQHRIEIFKNNTSSVAQRMGFEVLTSIPLSGTITDCCDGGVPVVCKHRDSAYAKSFASLAQRLLQALPQEQSTAQ